MILNFFCSFLRRISEMTNCILLYKKERLLLGMWLNYVKQAFIPKIQISFFLKILFIYFQRGGREGEREGEKHQCVVASRAPPTGDLAHNSGICPDWELNLWHFGSQARAQSTELHQPGPKFLSPENSLIPLISLWYIFTIWSNDLSTKQFFFQKSLLQETE